MYVRFNSYVTCWDNRGRPTRTHTVFTSKSKVRYCRRAICSCTSFRFLAFHCFCSVRAALCSTALRTFFDISVIFLISSSAISKKYFYSVFHFSYYFCLLIPSNIVLSSWKLKQSQTSIITHTHTLQHTHTRSHIHKH